MPDILVLHKDSCLVLSCAAAFCLETRAVYPAQGKDTWFYEKMQSTEEQRMRYRLFLLPIPCFPWFCRNLLEGYMVNDPWDVTGQLKINVPYRQATEDLCLSVPDIKKVYYTKNNKKRGWRYVVEGLDRKKGDQQDTWMLAWWCLKAPLVSIQRRERGCLVIRFLRYTQRVGRRFWVARANTEESLMCRKNWWPGTYLSGKGLEEQSSWCRVSLLSQKRKKKTAKSPASFLLSVVCFVFYFDM